MFKPSIKEETKKFIELVHKYGMKILPYTATNFFFRQSPEFDEGWASPAEYDLGVGDGALAHCSANSPGWREKIQCQFATLLDEFDFDGIYIDTGYQRITDYALHTSYYEEEIRVASDEILAFEETRMHDGGMQDLLGMIYGEVNRRGKILKIHKEGFDTVRADFKVYDYLWVGECLTDIDVLREHTKDYDSYVIPDHDFPVNTEHERYLNTIPFMQFPLMHKNQLVSTLSNNADWDLMIKWLELYKKMTVFGTWSYVDISVPKLVKPEGEDTVVTAFVNTSAYIVIANYSYDEADNVKIKIPLTEVTVGAEEKTYTDSITVEPRQMRVFRVACEIKTTFKAVSFDTDKLY